jgi:hypothetical protein
MTKKRVAILSLTLLILIGWMLRQKTEVSETEVAAVAPSPMPLHEVFAQFEARAIIDQKRQPVLRLPASVSYINKPSPDWENKLQANLRQQGGASLKQINVRQERSLIWLRDENALLVESVVISLKNHQDVESSFRALIDTQTGKVLETWDRTIFDPIDKTAELRFKLDPRYSN